MRTSEKMLRPTKGAIPHFMNSRMKNEFAYSLNNVPTSHKKTKCNKPSFV